MNFKSNILFFFDTECHMADMHGTLKENPENRNIWRFDAAELRPLVELVGTAFHGRLDGHINV